MFSVCPKCRHAVAPATPAAEMCAACGLVFRKYLQSVGVVTQAPPAGPEAAEGEEPDEAGSRFVRWFLYVPEDIESWRVYTGAALLALSVYFGIRYAAKDVASAEMMGTFLHTAMVPFHEFGHLLFMPFGEFMHVAGGSLAQWLMPLGFLWYFTFRRRDNLTAALMLWWCGTQFLSLAPYAWDAAKPELILLTGRTGDEGAHDYIDMLGDLGLLSRAHQVAWVMHKTGIAVMLAAWMWGTFILWRQFGRRTDFVRG
jgi:hypothetical protein